MLYLAPGFYTINPVAAFWPYVFQYIVKTMEKREKVKYRWGNGTTNLCTFWPLFLDHCFTLMGVITNHHPDTSN